MSKENVELVRRLIPAPDIDIARLFREGELFRDAEALSPLFDPDFECAIVMPGEERPGRRTYRGFPEGLQAAWLDWLEPWVSYHTRIERLVDLGDRVLALVRDRGAHTGWSERWSRTSQRSGQCTEGRSRGPSSMPAAQTRSTLQASGTIKRTL